MILRFLPFVLAGLHALPAVAESDRHFSDSLFIAAPPAQVWQVETDLARWPLWDTGLQRAEAATPLHHGVHGTMTDRDGRRSLFVVDAWEPGCSYTVRITLPLGAMYLRRSLQEVPGGTRIHHEVFFKGISAGFFARMVGRRFRPLLPETMQRLKSLVEAV